MKRLFKLTDTASNRSTEMRFNNKMNSKLIRNELNGKTDDDPGSSRYKISRAEDHRKGESQ